MQVDLSVCFMRFLIVVKITPVQNIHVNVVVATNWFDSLNYIFCKSRYRLIRLLGNMPGDQIFDISVFKAFEVSLKVIETDHDPVWVRVKLQVFVNQPDT